MTTDGTTSRALALLLALLSFVLAAPALMAALFFPVIMLAGPHSDLLPGALQSAVMVLAWLVILFVPVWLAVKVYRRVRQHPLRRSG